MTPRPEIRTESADRGSSAIRLVPEVGGFSVEALIEEAQIAERQGRRAEARARYEQALFRLRDPAEASLAASLLRWIGMTWQMDADAEAAFDCFEAALAVASACGDVAGIGHAQNARAVAHFRLGQLEEAEELYRKARESARRSGEDKLSAMTSQNLGVIANIRGELEEALAYYEASLAEYRALGLPKYICSTLNNLGMLYTRMERWDTAARAYDEAVQIAQVLGDLPTRILLEVNRASHLIARQDYANARASCDLAMELSRQTRDTHALGETYKCYGVIARETGDFVLAEESFNHASRIAEERQDLLLAAETSREMAEMYRRQGRNRDTLQCLNRAHRLFSQLHARPDLADIDRQTSLLEADFLEMVKRWGDSIESKDHYTQGHCERVAEVSCALAEEAGLDPKSLFWFRIGALLHDVGKLMIPPDILNKAGPLTDEEWALVKQHPVAGVQMLADIDFPWDVRPIVESHHERWDGKGYPHGLAGEAIPFTARILCVADVYDALTSERSYKAAVDHHQAMQIMRSMVGLQFDPALFHHFERVMDRRHPMEVSGAIRVPVASPPDGNVPDALPLPVPAELDHLTGALPRRAFLETANTILTRRRPTEAPPTLLVVDVDHFKLVNDTYGHLQGDDVLRTVVGVFRRVLRSGDVIGRYGGDEFVILLPRTPVENAREVAERLRAAVEQERVPLRGDTATQTVGVTLSIGVAEAKSGEHVEAVFAAADRALYEAKRAGRNAVSTASGEAEGAKPQLALNRFIGRVEETRRLVRVLEAGFAGEPQLVAVAGEAGVGKSTLLKQLLPEVRLRGGQLVMGRCFEADVKPPYGPWAEVLTSIRARVDAAKRQWRELPRLVPGLGAGQELPPGEGTGSKYVLYDEIVEYLRLAAAAVPLVIVLDDMQWADSASWDTLEHLMTQVESDRILIAMTIRAEDAGTDVTNRRRRLSRDERFQELALHRLSREEVEQWLAAASQGQELGHKLLPALYRHTEGNPFLVLQVLRALIEEGEIRYVEGRWTWYETSELRLPVAVSDLMARRLDRLSPKTRGILTTAAVIGREFDLDLAIAAGAGTEDDVLDAVDEAVAAAVLEPSRQDTDHFTFAHALLVEAIKNTANARRLRRVHFAVAEALEKHQPSAVAEIASHYDQAAESERAYVFAMEAGRRAMGVYAHGEAAQLFSIAHRHAGTPKQRLEAAVLFAQVSENAGAYAEGERLSNQILADVAETPETAAALRALRRLRERLRALQGQRAQDTLEVCLRLLEDATAAGDETERVNVLMILAQTYGRLGAFGDAERAARDAVAMAERLENVRLQADAVQRLGSTLNQMGSQVEGLQQHARAVQLFTEVGDLHGITSSQISIGIAHSMNGDMAGAERAYRQAITTGKEAHAPGLMGLASVNLGVLFLNAGRFEEANACYLDALRNFTTVKNELHRAGTLYNVGLLAREQGDQERALSVYAETAELAQHLGQVDIEIGARAGAGLAALTLGRADAAVEALETVNRLLEQRGSWWFQGRELADALAFRVAVTRGDVQGAVQQLRQAVANVEPRDPYRAAWLVAEVAPTLLSLRHPAGRELLDRFAPRVDEAGYTQLSLRFAEMRASVA